MMSYIGIGSNLGDRVRHIEKALSCLERSGGVRITRASSLYETEPVGGPAQPWFINGAIEAEVTLSPRQLLSLCQDTERGLGRVREIDDGPRIIDLDILFYEKEIIVESDLVVPHPRISLRRFVLAPLVEIAPDFIHPLSGKSLRTLLHELHDPCEVRMLSHPGSPPMGGDWRWRGCHSAKR